MSCSKLFNRLQRRLPNADPEELRDYLDDAESAILNRLYPFATSVEGKELPSRYYELAVRIATYFYDKQGAEGETVHVENGIHRHYEGADIPPSMLAEITPFIEVL